MSVLPPRLVLVSRPTELDGLLAAHATMGQVEFFLDRRGEALAPVEARHARQVDTLRRAREAAPADWSVAQVMRNDLDRFNFAARDIVVAVGQDGLVANIAKYLSGQSVIGVPTDPDRNVGVLTRSPVGRLPALLRAAAHSEARLERRTMARAELSDGQSLLALNEIFIGHRSHQSARYMIRHAGTEERHSSSGLIVSTGTGMTGWARSIMAASGVETDGGAPGPSERALQFFAREPWPSDFTGTELRAGRVEPQRPLSVTSRQNSGGVVFADGIESDFLAFNWGVSVSVAPARQTLNLVAES